MTKVITKRAGLVPYCRASNGQTVMAFFVPSDENYGGLAPQIAKGQIDEGETAREAAVREAFEELGLDDSLFVTEPELLFETHEGLSIFAVQISSMNFNHFPGYETSHVVFLTADQFQAIGRDWQRTFIKLLDNKIKGIK